MAAGSGLTKNQRRRLKKRAQKQAEANGVKIEPANTSNDTAKTEEETAIAPPPDVEVEYVSADLSKELALPQDDPAYEEMTRVFGRFSSAEELCGATDNVDGKDDDKKEKDDAEGEDDLAKEKAEEDQILSRKARKKSKRLSVAELKQLVSYPDVVEAHDVTSADPRLLVYLKSYRNTVPVPRHWCHKRKYLQGKRGFEKQPFRLPEFIAQTGIAEVRDSVAEDDEKKRNKQRARERVQPKMGRVDIDYQVLHDAFFRFQTKPKLTQLGDVYYEGKEFEVKLKSKVPGQLSDELKAALGMVEGVPPPWLLNVQRYGPPPAYPNLKIPGLNAPIPEDASFGYHPGGWGKPPVDENGVPLYGDVFGKAPESENQGEGFNRERWGELEEQEEEEEEGEGEEEQTEGAVEVLHPASPRLVSWICARASEEQKHPMSRSSSTLCWSRRRRQSAHRSTVQDMHTLYPAEPRSRAAHARRLVASGVASKTRLRQSLPIPRKTKTRLPRRKRKPRRTRARSSRISNSKYGRAR
ncbi:Splicing factor 3B subunit 2 [Phytophthora idaei]|nr:Splicing factor 3B subunit 2 [Phytophthora idaei]KAG3153683.1 Splicing factor 3B subunit 2 [Phytophthora idaei]KAG3246799.1 Splicing factor 3B subunit 2 [Phytophthora idaei]